MKLSELLKNAGIAKDAVLNFKDVEISGICPDSKRIKIGELYIAISGVHTDGHAFLPEAECRGAVAALVSKDFAKSIKNADIPYIACENTRETMSYLYSAFFSSPEKRLRLIGVTGTNGKTSTASLIYEILKASGRKCGLIGTLGSFCMDERLNIRSADENANMTTPDPEELYKIFGEMADRGAEYVIMEVSSHALALSKLAPLEFEVGVFTNLTPEHLDFHGDMESYFAAKSKLFKQCRRAVINYDDKYGRILADNIKNSKQSYICAEGLILCSQEGRECDKVAEDIHLHGRSGIEYKLSARDLRLRVVSPLSGDFNVMNTMQAACAAHAIGVRAKYIKDAIANFSGAQGRLELVKLGARPDISVYIDYAHTPDALENLIRCARGFAERDQRIVVLFGCGGDRDRQKRPLMGKVAVSMADLVIITADNSRSERVEDIIGDILSGVSDDDCSSAQYTVIPDRREAIEYAIKNARRGDIIFLCGKGHEQYEIDADGKRAFSEREAAIAAAEKYRNV